MPIPEILSSTVKEKGEYLITKAMQLKNEAKDIEAITDEAIKKTYINFKIYNLFYEIIIKPIIIMFINEKMN